MSKTWTIVVREQELVFRRCTKGRKRGPVINDILERYAHVVRRSMPRLSERHQAIVRAALHGASHTARDVMMLSHRVRDYAIQYADGEADALRMVLSGMSYVECLALIDDAEVYWAEVYRGDEKGKE